MVCDQFRPSLQTINNHHRSAVETNRSCRGEQNIHHSRKLDFVMIILGQVVSQLVLKLVCLEHRHYYATIPICHKALSHHIDVHQYQGDPGEAGTPRGRWGHAMAGDCENRALSARRRALARRPGSARGQRPLVRGGPAGDCEKRGHGERRAWSAPRLRERVCRGLRSPLVDQ